MKDQRRIASGGPPGGDDERCQRLVESVADIWAVVDKCISSRPCVPEAQAFVMGCAEEVVARRVEAQASDSTTVSKVSRGKGIGF